MQVASNLLPLVLAAGICAVAIGCGDGGACLVGSERCACTTAGACDPGLTCLAGFCVDASADGGTDGSVNGDASPGLDATTTDAAAEMDASRDAKRPDASDAGADGPDAASGGCDPVTQSGCSGDRRCAIQVETGEASCIAPGSVSPGEPCSQGSDGYDDCASVDGRGSLCVSGTCRTLCDTGGIDPCVEGTGCAELLIASSRVGSCQPTCRPVLQDCSDPEHACYWSYEHGHGFCQSVATPEGVQDEACEAPEGGTACFDNGCAAGYGPQYTSADTSVPERFCAYYCRPADTHTGETDNAIGVSPHSCAIADGGPGPGYQCRFMQSSYLGEADIPADLGYCVSTSAGFGDCTMCDISSPETFLDTCTGGPDPAPGCVSEATLDAVFAMGETVCDDGRDADADGTADCDDPDCADDPACA